MSTTSNKIATELDKLAAMHIRDDYPNHDDGVKRTQTKRFLEKYVVESWPLLYQDDLALPATCYNHRSDSGRSATSQLEICEYYWGILEKSREQANEYPMTDTMVDLDRTNNSSLWPDYRCEDLILQLPSFDDQGLDYLKLYMFYKNLRYAIILEQKKDRNSKELEGSMLAFLPGQNLHWYPSNKDQQYFLEYSNRQKHFHEENILDYKHTLVEFKNGRFFDMKVLR